MPIYLFKNTKTGKIHDIYLPYSEVSKGYKGEDGKEDFWERVFTVPSIMTDTANRVDAYKQSDFLKATENKKGTLGDIMDLSRELSEKRKQKDGVDKVKQKMFNEYSKTRNGKEHPGAKKERLKSLGIQVDYKNTKHKK